MLPLSSEGEAGCRTGDPGYGEQERVGDNK